MQELTPNTLPSRLTVRLIAEEALRRDWRVFTPVVDSSHITLERPDGAILPIFSACPPSTTYVAAHAADDKFITHQILANADLPVLQTFRCQTDDEIHTAVEKIVMGGKRYVIKPLDAGHANGITVRLQTLEQAKPAVAYAREYSSAIIVQEYVNRPIDLRVLCIDGKVIGVLERIPARVTGDGEHTIAELIAEQNLNRGAAYTDDLSQIPEARSKSFLGAAIDDIPQAGEVVSVLGTANIGMGGESRDVTDTVPQWLLDMSVRAARAMQLPVCGVDFLISQDPQPHMTIADLKPAITEVNKCPSLFIHDRPMHGQPRPATKAYVDYLATL